MKVGVIGSKSSCEVVKKSIKEIDSSVEVASYEEEQVNRSDRLIEECEQECDAVLFTGCAIESFVGRNYHFTRPHVSVEKSVISIAGAFLQMQKSNIELDAFSIDIVEKQVIEVAPLAYMRGRTLDDAFIILDEAQNTTPEQMKMFLTRMGVGSKVVVTGDVTQVDLPDKVRSGLVDALQVLRDVDGIAQVRLTEKDVVRHRLVQQIVKAYEKAAAGTLR